MFTHYQRTAVIGFRDLELKWYIAPNPQCTKRKYRLQVPSPLLRCTFRRWVLCCKGTPPYEGRNAMEN